MVEILNNRYINDVIREDIINDICNFIAYDFMDVFRDNTNINELTNSLAIQGVAINNYVLVKKTIKKCKDKLNEKEFRNYLNIKNNGFNILEYALLINKNLNIQINETNDDDIKNKLINDEINNEKIIIDILLNYYNLFDDNNKLFKIITYGNDKIIKYTLDHIKNLEITDSENNNLLHTSVKTNNLNLVKYLLNKYSNKRNIILQVNNYNQNSVDIAVVNRNPEIVDFLTSYIYENMIQEECSICMNVKKSISLKCHHTHKVCICCYHFIDKCPLCREQIIKNT